MNNEFFEQKMFNNFEGPMKKIMELNVKMMQNLSLMKPMDLLSVKRPEEFFEKNMELFIQNSHMTLSYMRETFNIIENHWLNVSRNMDQSGKKMMSEASSTMKKSTKKASTAAKTAAKKTASSAKKVASATKKAAPTAKKASSSVKKASAKKNTKAAQSKTTALKAKQEAKNTPSKSTIMHHAKMPMSQNAPKANMTTESNMPKVGGMTEKSKDLGMQNKSNSMPN